jgi:hypothetical protein
MIEWTLKLVDGGYVKRPVAWRRRIYFRNINQCFGGGTAAEDTNIHRMCA